MLKRIKLLVAVGALCLMWALADSAQAQCVVDTSTPTYANGQFLRYNPCDANGNEKMSLGTLLVGEDETNNVQRIESQWEYEDVAASQTDQAMGTTGAVGDLFDGIVCNTSAASVGVVSIKDGSGASFTLFNAQAGATTQPLQLHNLGWVSVNGAWYITTGTNTTCKANGRFS